MKTVSLLHSVHKNVIILLLTYQVSLIAGYNTGKILDDIFNNYMLTLGFAVQELNSTNACFLSELVNYNASVLVDTSLMYSICAKIYLLGGYNILGSGNKGTAGQYFTRSFTSLPSHNMVYLSFTHWRIDSWDDPDYFDVGIGSKVFSAWKYPIGYWPQVNYCGLAYADSPNYRIFARARHSLASLALNFTMRNDQGSDNEAAGFRDISLFFATTSSSVAMNETMCVVSPITLPGGQCDCLEGQYMSINGSCLTCHSLCKSCFDSSAADCYQCAKGASFNGTSCVQCDASCAVCTGPNANECVECVTGYVLYNSKYCIVASKINSPLVIVTNACNRNSSTGICDPGLFLYWDNSCSSSCVSPLTTISTSLPYMQCNYICTSSQYLYWNGSCISTCGSPLVTSIIGSRNLCTYPCSASQYLNASGSCLNSCTYPMNIRTEVDKNYCDMPCQSSDYYCNNVTCITSCPPPMIAKNINNVQICLNPCAINQYLYWNETCGSICNPPLIKTIVASHNLCMYPCSASQYLNASGSCLTSCTYPMNIRTEVDKNYCDLPCQASEYYYNNVTCITSCPSPMKVITVDSAQICRKPCYDPTPFFYWDGSCAESCDSPLTIIDSPLLYSKCNYSCSPDQFLYWNGICRPACSFPLVTKILKSRNLCIYPCSSGQYLNWNGLCLSSCVYPKKTRVEVGKNYCDLPCLISEFFYENGTCFSSCSSPMRIVTIDSAQICRKPCLDPTPYYCPDDQNCMSVCTAPSKVFDKGFYTSCELQISAEGKKAAEGFASMSNNAGNASSVTTMATSVLSASDPGGVSAGMLTKMLQYTKFLAVEHTARLEVMLKSSKLTTGFLFFAPKVHTSTKEKFKNHLLPAEFIKYKVHSSFIINFWDGFMSLAICIGILFFVFLLEVGTRSKDTESYLNFFVQKVRYGIQNFLLMQFYNCYGDIMLFSVLDISTVEFNTSPAAISFNMAFISIFVGIVVLSLHIMLLLKYQRVKRQSASNEPHEENVDKFSKSHEGIQALFFSFKDTSLVTQGFFLFLTVRNVSYSLIVTLLYKYTLIQLILMMILSIAMVGYLLFARPFKRLVNLFQQLLGEIILLIVNGSLFAIFIITQKAPNLTKAQDNLNDVIIMSNIIVGFIAPAFLVIKIVIIIIEKYKRRRDWANQQNRVLETLEEQVRKRQQKNAESKEEPKNRLSQFRMSVPKMIKGPRNLLSVSTQIRVRPNLKLEIIDAETPELQIPNFQRQTVSHAVMLDNVSLSQVLPVELDIKEEFEAKDDSLYNQDPIHNQQKDFDASSTKFKQDMSELDIQEKSFDARKTRWLSQRQKMRKFKR